MTRDEFKDLLMDYGDAEFDCGDFNKNERNCNTAKYEVCIEKAKWLRERIMEEWEELSEKAAMYDGLCE